MGGHHAHPPDERRQRRLPRRLWVALLAVCSMTIGWDSTSAAYAAPTTAPSTSFSSSASAKPRAQHFRPPSSLSARAQYCVGEAAAFHRVNADVLHAIILVESDGRPLAIRRNSNGTVDVGMAQINTVHFAELARYGIAPEHLFDECIAAFVAAWHYARQVRRLGNTWQAIGAYHSRTPHLNEAYQRRVMRRLMQLGVWAPGRMGTSKLPQG